MLPQAPRIVVAHADFDAQAEAAQLLAQAPDCGALASFTGLMRATEGAVAIDALELEHYPGMTESALVEIACQAGTRWQLQAVTVYHRVGQILPGQQIVYVGVAARHRGDAFAACEFIMDYLKTRAPLWKKEIINGQGQWVEARASDELAAQRWQQ